MRPVTTGPERWNKPRLASYLCAPLKSEAAMTTPVTTTIWRNGSPTWKRPSYGCRPKYERAAS